MTELVANYKRGAGLHTFITQGGEHIGVVSANSWQAFTELLRTRFLSGYDLLVAPERMADVEARGISGVASAQRVIEAQVLSKRFPLTPLLLGATVTTCPILTPREDPSRVDERPYNGLVAIKDMLRSDVGYKRNLGMEEMETFRAGDEGASPIPGHSQWEALIGADLVLAARFHKLGERSKEKPYISPSARTLIVSSCWTEQGPIADAALTGQLERLASSVFEQHPLLEDIVIADRTPQESSQEPLNVHYARMATAT
jgi:hypothetical protein